ncbi:MAG: hypothetical protein A3A72_01880 [Deltaproteobacteria bacterium RIFCSPLOWO2_01_FULL_38_9]|nr:MAG: hypothetical protein A3A72_01880 [Deltaproteobacteria bacterium RIFCSPLOWO2_01_FULL_38_9]
MVRYLLVMMICLGHVACGYHFYSVKESLPGGVKRVSIATFKNDTNEAGIENTFTSALRNEFFKSKVIKIVDSQKAEAEIIGRVKQISIDPTAQSEKQISSRGTKILALEYNVNVSVDVSLIRRQDQKVLWARTVSDYRRYSAGENLLQNETKQREAFEKIAVYVMEQAHDMMFENF